MEGARQDLAWWQTLDRDNKIGRYLWLEKILVELTADACMAG